ncbi:MAG: hypothetical protein ACR2JR_02170 [Rubrobacteraceae bacterium]
MSATGRIQQAVRLFVLPFLYFASVLPVFIGVVATTVIMEEQIGLYRYNAESGIGSYGNIALLTSLLVVVCPVFGLTSWMIHRLESVPHLTLTDHLRRCAFHYVFTTILGTMFAVEFVGNLLASDPIYVVSRIMVAWVIAGCAIVMDALVSVQQRRRFARATEGSPG